MSSSSIPGAKYSVDDFFVLKKLSNAQHAKTILSTFSGSRGIACLNTLDLQVKMPKHFPQISLLLNSAIKNHLVLVSSNKILMEMLIPNNDKWHRCISLR